MRKILVFILCMSLSFSVWGCGSNSAENLFNKELLEFTSCSSVEDVLNWASDSLSFKIISIESDRCEIDDGYWAGEVGFGEYYGEVIGTLSHTASSISKRDEEFLKIAQELKAICGEAVEEHRENNALVSATYLYNGVSIRIYKSSGEGLINKDKAIGLIIGG